MLSGSAMFGKLRRRVESPLAMTARSYAIPASSLVSNVPRCLPLVREMYLFFPDLYTHIKPVFSLGVPIVLLVVDEEEEDEDPGCCFCCCSIRPSFEHASGATADDKAEEGE